MKRGFGLDNVNESGLGNKVRCGGGGIPVSRNGLDIGYVMVVFMAWHGDE